ncbi:MAG: diguanylate cyclase [bacterium]|nr:diguanylate cyclase [bacterium]
MPAETRLPGLRVKTWDCCAPLWVVSCLPGTFNNRFDPDPKKVNKEALSASRTMVTVAALAFVIEVMIMTFLGNWGLAAESLNVILFDAAMLSLCIAPAIYWLVLAPLDREHAKRVWAEDHSMALDRLATTDPYLRILNPRGVRNRLLEETARARRYKNPLSVARVRFGTYGKLVDSMSGEAAERSLSSAVTILSGALRLPDVLGRLHEGELLLLLPEADLAGARSVCQKLRLLLDQAGPDHFSEATGWNITMGVAQFDPGEDDRELLKRAESALERNDGQSPLWESRASSIQ